MNQITSFVLPQETLGQPPETHLWPRAPRPLQPQSPVSNERQKE